VDVRFPVQYVIRPQSAKYHDYRGYAGQVCSGVLRVGDEVVVVQSGFVSKIVGIDSPHGPVEEAFPPMSVSLRIADNLDVSRGDMFCRPRNNPNVGQDIDAMVCWMSDQPLKLQRKYIIRHTAREVRGFFRELNYRLDVNSLHRVSDASELGLNEVGRVNLRTTAPLFYDEYRRNRQTGSFIVIDEATNATVASGMIQGRSSPVLT
jgi:bifunctional enzyme CysN/CysC